MFDRRRELALQDLSDGRAWTFQQIADAVESLPPPQDALVCPQGSGPEFIFQVLRGWRHECVVCPLEENEARPVFPSPPSGIAHVKRTSATTGAARFVLFSAAQLAADADNIVATMGLRPDLPNLGVISLAHSYGFSNLALPLLLHGIPLFLVRSPLPEALRKACAGPGDFTLAGVPALWRVWSEANAIPQNIRLAISAGAPLPVSLENEVFEKTGVKIHNFLGSTECGGIAYDRESRPRTDGAMAGTALAGVNLSVGDGMLEVRSKAVGSGYWPEARKELVDGVFRASDLVEIIDGRLFVRGRSSDVIHIAGRKVAPEEIERALGKHPKVRECLVFDAPRPGLENQIVAAVVGDGIQSAELSAFLTEQLPAWQIPRQWRFVPSLDANERGKVSRAEWRKRFLSGAA